MVCGNGGGGGGSKTRFTFFPNDCVHSPEHKHIHNFQDSVLLGVLSLYSSSSLMCLIFYSRSIKENTLGLTYFLARVMRGQQQQKFV